MVEKINNFDELPQKRQEKLFDPASDEAERSIFDRIKQEIDKGHYSKINSDLLFWAKSTAQNDFSSYDKDRDGILATGEIKELKHGSKDVYDYMNTKTDIEGKKIYTDTDYASYVLNYYDKHTVNEEK